MTTFSLAASFRKLSQSTLLRRSSLSLVDQAVVSGMSFATSVLVGRCASREDLGTYYLALSLVLFARGVQEQLVCAPYMVYCGRKEGGERSEYAGSALVHQLVLAALAAGLLLAALVGDLPPRELRSVLWLLAAGAPLFLVREFARQMSFAHLDLRGATILDIAAAAVQFVALVTLAATGRLTVLTTLTTLAVASGLPTIGWLAATPQPMVARVRTVLRDWLHNWPFARWALASHLLACTTPYVMPWVVALAHGEAETGMLGACMTLVGLSNTFLTGLCNFLTPQAAQAFARGGLAELRSVLAKTAAIFLSSLGLLAVAAFLCGERVCVLLYGPEYAGAGPIIGILSLSVLANSIGVTAGNGLFAMERPSANFLADLASLAVVIVCTLLLIPGNGPLGAALAMLAGTASDAVVRAIILQRTMQELAGEGAAA